MSEKRNVQGKLDGLHFIEPLRRFILRGCIPSSLPVPCRLYTLVPRTAGACREEILTEFRIIYSPFRIRECRGDSVNASRAFDMLCKF